MSAFEIKSSPLFSQIVTLKAVKAAHASSVPFEWLSYGLACGLVLIFLVGLIFGSKTLKRSVWISQLLFAAVTLGSLSFAFFRGEAFGDFSDKIFTTLVRLQLVFTTIATFNLVRPTNGKPNLGSVSSGFLGAILGASFLNFLVPIEGLLALGDFLLMAGSLYLGGRFLMNPNADKFGETTLFFQLTTVLITSFTYFWLPDVEEMGDTSLFIFAFLSAGVLLTSTATTLSSARERTSALITRLQKDLFVTERRLARQNQVNSSQQMELATYSEALQRHIKIHRQDSVRDHLRIRSLEESSQDIAHGIRAQLRELQDDCLLVVQESKTPRYRMAFIKAYAERIHLLASRIENTAGFLLTTEAAHDFSSDKDVTLNASDFLKECLYLCSNKFRKVGIEVEIQSLATDLSIRGKPALLAQGFLGLIYNALEATENADVRRVTLVLRRVEDNDTSWVEFGISNSGPGIPTSIKSKAFHARERDGLGIHSLGLSMAFGIFEHAGGSLNLDTDAVATTLLARLPLIEKTEESSLRLVI